MRSLTIEVEFETPEVRQIPRVGQRKTLRVNGKREVLWANEVSVERCYDHKRSIELTTGSKSLYHYVGTVTYGPYLLEGPDKAL